MAICPQHLLLSRRLFRYPWIPQMFSDPPVHDFEGRLDCRGLHAHGLGTAGPDVCHPGTASVGVGVCGHHGVRIELHAFHSDHIFWGGDLVNERDPAEHKVDRGLRRYTKLRTSQVPPDYAFYGPSSWVQGKGTAGKSAA